MDFDWQALAKELRQARLEKNLSMEKLAELAGVSRTTIHQLEKGPARGRIPVSLPKIEEALGWPAGKAFALLSGTGPVAAATAPRRDPENSIVRAVEHAAIAVAEGLTVAQINELTRRVVADLREQGVLDEGSA